MVPISYARQSFRAWKQIVFIPAAVLLIGLATAFLPPAKIGENDLRAYWGAAFLLRQGQPFADYQLMQEIQERLTGWPAANGAMMTWNPPWILPLFIPLSLFGYDQAVWLWLFFSAAISFVSVLWVWQMDRPQTISPRQLAGLLFGTIVFVPWLQMVAIGQISSLILWGLAGYLFFLEKRPFLAGAFLLLTTAKPHVVMLVLPLLLFEALLRRRWPVLAGLITAAAVMSLITLAFRPTFLLDYVGSVSANQNVLFTRPSPSLPAILAVESGLSWLRFSGLVLLPPFIWWWFRHSPAHLPRLAAAAVLASAAVAPYGYPFDFSVLLLPIAFVYGRLASGYLSLPRSWTIALVFLTGNIMVLLLQMARAIADSFWWVPFWIALLYWLSSRSQEAALKT